MSRHTPFIAAPLIPIAALTLFVVPAQAAENFGDALTGGKAWLDARYRYESVSEENAKKAANASTLRLRFGYQTGDYKGFGALLEAEHLSTLDADNYNSTSNGKTAYSTIADPEFSEINQGYLSYGGISDTQLKYGRQRLVLDNQRFIGNVGWRQNEQTFDAFTAVNKSLPGTTITAGYIYNVNRVFSDHARPGTAGNFHMKSPILNVSYKGWSAGELAGYGYLLDFVDTPASSTETWGLRFTGERALADGLKLLYTAEYATQSDYKSNPANYRVDYGFLEGGLGKGAHSVKLGYERLEGDGTKSFQTPLATLHAFNGWADLFLTTPATGLEDAYLAAGTALYGVKLAAIYHDYRADQGNARYGSEWNLQATKAIDKHYLVGVKYATYNAKTFAVDTDKFWLWAEAKF